MMPDPSGAMLDTSVWVAIFQDEPVAAEVESAVSGRELITSPLVVAELASLAGRGRFESSSPMDIVIERARMEEFAVEDALAGGSLHARLRNQGNSKASLGDCVIYATARRVGALLVTCDADIEGEDGVVVLAQKKPRKKGR